MGYYPNPYSFLVPETWTTELRSKHAVASTGVGFTIAADTLNLEIFYKSNPGIDIQRIQETTFYMYSPQSSAVAPISSAMAYR